MQSTNREFEQEDCDATGRSPSSRYVLQRFALKTGILTLFALVDWRWNHFRTAVVLFLIAALCNASLAIIRSERPFGDHLNYWDEAVASIIPSIS